MLQKDYWSMSEAELAGLANTYNIESEGYDDAYVAGWHKDRYNETHHSDCSDNNSHLASLFLAQRRTQIA